MVATSATHTIFFVASVLVALSLVSVFMVAVDQFSSAIREDSNTLSTRLLTSVSFANDPEMVPYDSGNNNITFYLLNTGKTYLSTLSGNLLIYINGTVQPTGDIVLLKGETGTWGPGGLVSVNSTVSHQGGLIENVTYRAWVVVTERDSGMSVSPERPMYFKIKQDG